MNVLILYAHPEPTSFCGALKTAAVEKILAAGSQVTVSDLYAEKFDPVAGRHDFLEQADGARFHYQSEQLHAAKAGSFSLEIAREQARFAAADLVITIFPLWWTGVPAILKGWFDRVLAYGFAYVDGARFTTGLFPEKAGMICVTTGGTPERFSAAGVYGPIEDVLSPVQKSIFGYMGMQTMAPFVAYAAPRVDDAARQKYLEDWCHKLDAALKELPAHAIRTRSRGQT